MPIPSKIAVTYCRACECSLQTGGLCSYGCQWDATTNVHERPVVVKTYWLREEPPTPSTPFAQKHGRYEE